MKKNKINTDVAPFYSLSTEATVLRQHIFVTFPVEPPFISELNASQIQILDHLKDTHDPHCPHIQNNKHNVIFNPKMLMQSQ